METISTTSELSLAFVPRVTGQPLTRVLLVAVMIVSVAALL